MVATGDYAAFGQTLVFVLVGHGVVFCQDGSCGCEEEEEEERWEFHGLEAGGEVRLESWVVGKLKVGRGRWMDFMYGVVGSSGWCVGR